MKTRYSILAAMLIGLAACESNEDERLEPVSRATFSAHIEGVQTRAYDQTWEVDDAIGITGTSGSNAYKNVKYVTTGNGDFNPAEGAEPICYQDDADVKFTAYYPHNPLEGDATTIAADTKNQSDQKKFDFLYATGTGNRKTDNGKVAFTFAHKMSKLVLKISGGKEVSFDEVKNAVLTLQGFQNNGSFNTTDGTATASGDVLSEPWTISAPSTAESNTVSYTLIMFPQTFTSALPFTATTTGGREFTADLTFAKGWEAGKQYNLDITMEKTQIQVKACTIESWKEENMNVQLDEEAMFPEDVTVIINLDEPIEISDNGKYGLTGTGSKTIKVTGGSPTLYVKDLNLNVASGNAIDITGGASPTIHVMGENTIANNSSTDGAGIYVAEGSTVTITGRDRNDVLTANAGGDAAGIGGCSNNQNCGAINISNVTVIARGGALAYYSPGIGSTQTNQCGEITIDDATVHAYGEGLSNTTECPAIGAGLSVSGNVGTTLPTVTIRSMSEIHVHRGGSSADYIGYPFVVGISTGAASTINLGGGSCTSSTIYCYTGESIAPEHIYVYDNQGNRTEQLQ